MPIGRANTLILAVGWFGLNGRRKLKLVGILLAGVAAVEGSILVPMIILPHAM